jgi:CHAT domain-containing protein
VEKYTINNITARTIKNLEPQPLTEISLLAGAYANVSHDFELAGEKFNFSALPFTEIEVENIAQTFPKTKKVIDRNFTKNLIDSFDAYNVIHLATHGALVIGQPEKSFILFGDGEIVTLKDIKNWTLDNVDLVVLSACETALGGNFGSGIEILGLGYSLERAGVKAIISSLWKVDDAGTQMLMNAFYKILSEENITKAEALQKAQISLINSKNNQVNINTRAGVQVTLKPDAKAKISSFLSHPYYWSSFILIGNGL